MTCRQQAGCGYRSPKSAQVNIAAAPGQLPAVCEATSSALDGRPQPRPRPAADTTNGAATEPIREAPKRTVLARVEASPSVYTGPTRTMGCTRVGSLDAGSQWPTERLLGGLLEPGAIDTGDDGLDARRKTHGRGSAGRPSAGSNSWAKDSSCSQMVRDRARRLPDGSHLSQHRLPRHGQDRVLFVEAVPKRFGLAVLLSR